MLMAHRSSASPSFMAYNDCALAALKHQVKWCEVPAQHISAICTSMRCESLLTDTKQISEPPMRLRTSFRWRCRSASACCTAASAASNCSSTP